MGTWRRPFSFWRDLIAEWREAGCSIAEIEYGLARLAEVAEELRDETARELAKVKVH